jgi:hypothetical protein
MRRTHTPLIAYHSRTIVTARGFTKKTTTAREQRRPLPAQIRSEDRSGSTRHHSPTAPRGCRALLPTCDHQLIQHTVQWPHIAPIPTGRGGSLPDEVRPPESGHSTNSPGPFRSESGSGLTRHPGPSTPRGKRAVVPNCDHQLMQHTH